MQTKNVNLNQDQLNNSVLEKNAQLIQQQQQPLSPASPGSPPPPLPPRVPAEVEAAGYGQPYKPVPPPKPLPAAAAASGAASPPPPYRMPPYPLYGDAQTVPIPGSAAASSDLQPGVALHTHSSKFPIEREVILSSADKNSKIPILHEYKKRTKPATIAPEGPNKQIAWTEEKRQHLQQHHTMHGPVNGSDDTLILTTRTLHSLNLGDKSMALEDMSHQMYKAQPVQVPNEASRGKDYRSQFHNPYLYNGHHANAASTGAVPRAWGSSVQGRPPVPNQGPAGGQHQHQHHQQQLGAASQHHQDSGSTTGTGAVRRDHSGERARQTLQQQSGEPELVEDQNSATENNGKDKDGKDCGDKAAGKTFSTRTYHTIKDMISSRFGSGKLPKDVNASGADVEQGKSSQEGLNNNTVVNGEAGNEKSSPRKVRPQPLTGREDTEDEQRQQRLLGGGPSVSASAATSTQSASRGYVAGASEPVGATSYQYQQHASEGAVPSSSGYYHHQTPVGPRSHQQQQRQKALSPMSQQQANYASQLEQAGVYMVMRQAGTSSTAPAAAPSSQYLQAQQQYHVTGQQERADSNSGYATANLAGASGLPAQKQTVPPPPQAREGRRGSQSRLDLPDDEDDDDEGGFAPPGVSAPPPPPPSTEPPRTASSGQSSDYEKATQRSTGQSSSTAGDSGRGSTVYSSGRQPSVGGSSGGGGSVGGAGLPAQKDRLDTSTESSGSPRVGYGLHHQQPGAGAEPEWVDVVENELRQILDPKLHGLGAGSAVGGGGGANSTLSESISSLTPPLPPLSPGGSPTPVPRSYKHGNSLPYGSKLGDYDGGSGRKGLAPPHQQSVSGKPRGGRLPGGGGGGAVKPGSAAMAFDKHHRSAAGGGAGTRSNKDTKSKQLSASVFGLDTTDLTSTTTGGLDSVLDGHTENNSSDDDLSTTIDATDAQAIRRQLEGLESMYSEVLKLLGVKKGGSRYPPSDPPRLSQRRRVYGSLSSLPSSASSRPPATRPHERRRHDDHRKKVRDLKGINKRFQRLESHVVTLARSVAHLSSEMRTQHLMIQEMENIRGEIAALRTQTALHHHRSQSVPRALNVMGGSGAQGDAAGGLSNPSRVRKLTKFFGDEPPLLRLFLRRLGYEKYANVFENERVGMVELPYLTEERLQRMGVPLGPRIRILQEAQNFPPAPAPTAAQTATTPSSRHDKVYVV